MFPGQDSNRSNMTITGKSFHGTRKLKRLYKAVLCLFIISGIWRWQENNPRIGFTLTLKIAGVQFRRAVSSDSKVGANETAVKETGTFGWPIDIIISRVRRLLPIEAQHSMIIGLIKEDGSLNSEFITSGNLNGQSGDWDFYAGKVLNLSEVGNHIQGPGVTVKAYTFEMCPSKMRDYIPCLDDVAAIQQLPNVGKGEQRERHCPYRSSRKCCIIPKPKGYKTPVKWPRSKDEVWSANIRHSRQIWNDSWTTIQGEKFKFTAGGRTVFLKGVDSYLDQLAKMVPALAFGVQTRTALDVGCGVASFAAALLARGVLPLSMASKDLRNNHVQLALERGVPAVVLAFASRRLIFPSQAFDFIHCAECEIAWTKNGGILLIEVNRLLRAGGYFTWVATPSSFRNGSGQILTWHDMEDLANRLCWTLIAKEGSVAIWKKPYDNTCYQNRETGTLPPLCDEGDDADAVWYIDLKWCITRLPANITNGNLPEWPSRLSVPPERLHISLMDAEEARPDVFVSQQRHWNEIVSGYLRGLGLKREDVRNVMDMRAGYGGFAAALVDQHVDWWVMNVVPTQGPNSLSVIYDRGLLGVAHDWQVFALYLHKFLQIEGIHLVEKYFSWLRHSFNINVKLERSSIFQTLARCEPFDSYPRTYDLLHAVSLFSSEENRCNIAHIILEMDRLLRPGGWVLIRESKGMAVKVEALAKSLRWKTRLLETESGPYGKDKLLSCIKHR